jgi:hypothetical protein
VVAVVEESDPNSWQGWCGLVAKQDIKLLKVTLKSWAREWCAGFVDLDLDRKVNVVKS